jgi:hypothetical protein
MRGVDATAADAAAAETIAQATLARFICQKLCSWSPDCCPARRWAAECPAMCLIKIDSDLTAYDRVTMHS